MAFRLMLALRKDSKASDIMRHSSSRGFSKLSLIAGIDYTLNLALHNELYPKVTTTIVFQAKVRYFLKTNVLITGFDHERHRNISTLWKKSIRFEWAICKRSICPSWENLPK